MLSLTLKGRSGYFIFLHKEIDSERLDNISEVTQLISEGSGDFYWSYICIEIDFCIFCEIIKPPTI